MLGTLIVIAIAIYGGVPLALVAAKLLTAAVRKSPTP